MLKLKKISSHIRNIYNKSDYNAKIRILFQQVDPSEGVCYWNVYGQNNSFAEFTLYNPTGAIYDITVFFEPSSIQHENIPIISCNILERIGLPLFETYIEKYQDGYYHLPDEHIDFQIYVTPKNIYIVFSSNKVILHVVNDSVIFGFDQDNNLCYINLQNMTLNEEAFLENI